MEVKSYILCFLRCVNVGYGRDPIFLPVSGHDFEFIKNHCTKKLEWNEFLPRWDGRYYAIKICLSLSR